MTTAMESRHGQSAPSGFWEQPLFLLLVLFLSAVPLLWPDIPPLTDLPGHMGRYKVQIDLADSAALARYYDFEWALIGNLGVDLLVVPLSALFGLELAVKLIVLSIPPLTVGGFLWVSYEVQGRIPPSAFFALPFAYGFPFIFGFVNFALSMAFAFLAFAWWLRLARLRRFRLRAACFVPISALIWVTHTYGWGTLGLLAFSAEAVRQHDEGRGFMAAAFRAGLHCLSLTLPLLLMIVWRSGSVAGGTGDWFNWDIKLRWILMVLRDRWELFDLAALGIIVLVLIEAIRNPRLEYSRNLAASALVLLLMYLLLPRILIGSAYADMRLVPYLFAVAVLAIRYRAGASARHIRIMAIAGVAFFLVRTAGTTISFWMYDKRYDRELAALEHLPVGARLVSLVGQPCKQPWALSRLYHLPGMAIVRKEAFSNEQWAMPGAQLLRIEYQEGAPFTHDPSQMVTMRKCRGEIYRTVGQGLAQIRRQAFDYVWLIDAPPFEPELVRGLTPVWRDGRSVLFRVER